MSGIGKKTLAFKSKKRLRDFLFGWLSCLESASFGLSFDRWRGGKPAGRAADAVYLAVAAAESRGIADGGWAPMRSDSSRILESRSGTGLQPGDHPSGRQSVIAGRRRN